MDSQIELKVCFSLSINLNKKYLERFFNKKDIHRSQSYRFIEMSQKDTKNSPKAVPNNNQSSPSFIIYGILLIVIINFGLNIFTYHQDKQRNDPKILSTFNSITNGGYEQPHAQQLIYDDTQLKEFINFCLQTTKDLIISSIKQQLVKFSTLINKQAKTNLRMIIQQNNILQSKKPTKTGANIQKSNIAIIQQLNEQIKNTERNLTQIINKKLNRIVRNSQNSINHNILVMGKYFQKLEMENYYRFQSIKKEIQILYQYIQQLKEIQQQQGNSEGLAYIEEDLQNSIELTLESDKFKNLHNSQQKQANDWNRYQFDQIDLFSYFVQSASNPQQFTFDLSQLFSKSNRNAHISPNKFIKLVEAHKSSQEARKFDSNDFQLETLDLSHNYLSQQDLSKVISSLLQNYNSVFQNITQLYLSTCFSYQSIDNNKIKSLQKIIAQKQNSFLYLEQLNLGNSSLTISFIEQNQHLNLKQILELSKRQLKFLKTLVISESALLPVSLSQSQKKKNENIEEMFSNVQKLIINIKEKWPLFELLIIQRDQNNQFRSPQFYKIKDGLRREFLLNGWFGRSINFINQPKQSQKLQSQMLTNNFLVIWE